MGIKKKDAQERRNNGTFSRKTFSAAIIAAVILSAWSITSALAGASWGGTGSVTGCTVGPSCFMEVVIGPRLTIAGLHFVRSSLVR